ncbi:GGDEF domain-containing protein [Azohydromonas aeria]|uniref:GGDEF domain-containing protein n=1 Tax=Azohydromonas aeria TaxID=2590212 RepID=UPI0012FB4A71|nr:diguanylate cyclase [Azohydromonas aeria]
MSTLSTPVDAASGGMALLSDAALAALLGRLMPAWLAHQGTLLAVKDASSGAWLHVNEAMAKWLQCEPAALLGRGDAALEPPLPMPLRAAEQHALDLPPDKPLQSEHRFEWRGALHEFSVWREIVELPDGRRVLCSLWTDLAPQRRDQQRLRELLQQLELQQRLSDDLCRRCGIADTDGPLDRDTGLHLRSFFEEQLQRAVTASRDEGREFALVWVALDVPPGAAGVDAASQAQVRGALARLLRANTRAADSTCRLEGDCFGVLMSGLGLGVAYGRMEQLRRQCAAQIVVNEGRTLRFTVSMGVASCPHTAADADALSSASEAALAEARGRGGDHVVLARVPFMVPG